MRDNGVRMRGREVRFPGRLRRMLVSRWQIGDRDVCLPHRECCMSVSSGRNLVRHGSFCASEIHIEGIGYRMLAMEIVFVCDG